MKISKFYKNRITSCRKIRTKISFNSIKEIIINTKIRALVNFINNHLILKKIIDIIFNKKV